MNKMFKYLRLIAALVMLLGFNDLLMANGIRSNGLSGAYSAFQLTLASFDYVEVNSHQVCFKWTTSQEYNVEQMELQASEDSVHFVTIDVQAATNVKFGHTYYSSVVNSDQFNYYRLVIVNENGDKEYSKTIRLNPISSEYKEVSIFPNPITALTFNVKVLSMNQTVIKVFNRDGKLLYTTNLQGQFQYNIKLPSAASGNINLVVQVSSEGKTQSFNVLNI
ncbi:MAG: T9SS type A sorting domain-containing protein [Chitinophagales bacterium]